MLNGIFSRIWHRPLMGNYVICGSGDLWSDAVQIQISSTGLLSLGADLWTPKAQHSQGLNAPGSEGMDYFPLLFSKRDVCDCPQCNIKGLKPPRCLSVVQGPITNCGWVQGGQCAPVWYLHCHSPEPSRSCCPHTSHLPQGQEEKGRAVTPGSNVHQLHHRDGAQEGGFTHTLIKMSQR